MAVAIRLQRRGRSKRPFYRIVAIDSRNQRDGIELERLGWYNPLTTNDNINIKEERINYWLNKGARTSDAVDGLFKKIGFSLKRDLLRQGKTESEIDKVVSDFLKQQQTNKLEKLESKKKTKDSAAAQEAAEEAPSVAEEAPAASEEAAEEAPVAAEEAVEEAPAVAEKPAEEAPSVAEEVSEEAAEEAPAAAEEAAEEAPSAEASAEHKSEKK